MSALTVRSDESARLAGDVDAVIASLPVSLAPATDSADLVALGGGDGWATRATAALEAGARGVLVVEPVAPLPAALAALGAVAGGRPVILDRAFAGNPGLEAVRSAIADAGEHALLEARVLAPLGSDPDAVLLGQLALVRAVAAPVRSARLLARDEHGYTIRGVLADGRGVLLTAVLSDARPAAAQLRLLGATSAVEIDVPTPVAARPLRATLSTADGATLLPTRYETSHRANWRRLLDLVSSEAAASDIDDLVEDLAVAASL